MKKLHCICAAVALTGLLFTATARADELADLKARFQSRDPAIQKLKSAGTAGETYLGYIDVPGSASADAAAQALLADENADRKRLYTLIAAKEDVKIEVVADRNAKRNFGRAASGEWLKFPDGVWRKKG